MTETVLLTGISGFIAKHVALKLLAAGYKVRGTLRRLDRAGEVRAALAPHLDAEALARLSFAAADLEADTGWPEAMAGVQALIHTASPFPIEEPADADALIRPAVEGTTRVLLAAKAAGVTRVVLTSSTVAVLGDGASGLLDEANWTDPSSPGTSAYTRSKTLAERAAWAIAEREGLALTAINPGFVMGPPLDGNFGASIGLVRRLLSGKDPLLPEITFVLVDVRDVAEMHLRALQRPETAGKRYLATSGTLSMLAMGRLLKSTYPQRRIATRRAPKPLLRVLALFDKQIRASLPLIGLVPQVSNARARADLGMDFIPPADALTATAAWLVASGKV